MRYLLQLLVTLLLLTISTLSYAQCAGPVPLLMCDTNGDWSVDSDDITAIGLAKGSPATGDGDTRDIDKDGSITVEDNGGGFKAESLGQVFDPYVTSKPKGTGLGLAIVKNIVNAHEGKIIYRKNSRGGAIFCVQLSA